MKALSRRAMFGLLAGGGALAAGAADACSLARQTCRGFSRDLFARNAVVRARVVRVWNEWSDEFRRFAEIEARVTETLTGAVRKGRTFQFSARTLDCNGLELGHVPKQGKDAILFLTRDREDDSGWEVESTMDAADFDRWARRCDL